MDIKDLVIGKDYNFENDGIVTLVGLYERGFYVKGSDLDKRYLQESDGSVSFGLTDLHWLTEKSYDKRRHTKTLTELLR